MTKRTFRNVAKIADFGLSKRVGETITGTRGTVLYMAPEMVLMNQNNLIIRTSIDVFSLANTVFEIMFEIRPYNLQGQYEYMIISQRFLKKDTAQKIPDDGEARYFLEKNEKMKNILFNGWEFEESLRQSVGRWRSIIAEIEVNLTGAHLL